MPKTYYLISSNSGTAWLASGAAAMLTTYFTADIVIIFGLAVLGAFGSMGLAKNTRHLLSEALAGICIGTGGGVILIRWGVGSPIPELTALVLGIGGLVVPVTIRRHLGDWILELKERFFKNKDDNNGNGGNNV